MLKAILALISAIKSGDIKAILSAIAALILAVTGGDTAPLITMSQPGETHPTDTTAAHTITLH